MKCCDGRVVALLLQVGGGLLLVDRARPPHGWAPPAGHVDNHGTPEQAMRAEVFEEVGLTVAREVPLVWSGWLPNVCRRPGSAGHMWWVWAGAATGLLSADPREVRGCRWVDRFGVKELAAETVAYAYGLTTDAQWREDPGLEPAWVRLFTEMGWLTLADDDMAAVERLYTKREK